MKKNRAMITNPNERNRGRAPEPTFPGQPLASGEPQGMIRARASVSGRFDARPKVDFEILKKSAPRKGRADFR